MSQNTEAGQNASWAGDSGGADPYPQRWLAFAVVLLASVMDLLDSLVTNVAAPSIRQEIGGGTEVLQWLGAAYTLAMAAGLVTGGRLGDIYGRRTVFLVGAVAFTASSVLCGVSTGPGMLIGARVAQGLFGALMLPQGLGVIKEVFPPQDLAKAFGAFGPVLGLSSVCGPTLAGWLIDADYFGTGWRMIFFINLPLGLLAIVGAILYLPRTRNTTASKLDLVGVGLVSLGALLIVYPVVQGRALGWPIWAFLSMAASVVVFAIFGRYEVRKQAAGGEPLVIPSLFRKRAFTGGLVAGLAFFTALVGFSLVFTIFLQVGLGYSALHAGLAALPQAGGSVIGFIAAGAGLANKFGRRLIQAGTVVSFAGIAIFYLVLHSQGVDVHIWQLIPALLLMGIGLGLVLAPFFDIVLAGVEPHESGSASGTLTAMQQFGSALGIAVLGTIFFGVLGGQITDNSAGRAPQLRAQLQSVGVPAAQQEAVVTSLRDCGSDSASATDPDQVPASCLRLKAAVGAAAASSPDGAKVGAVVTAASAAATRQGFADTMERTIWVSAGLQALTFLLAFLLPLRAREEWPGQAPGAPEPAGQPATA